MSKMTGVNYTNKRWVVTKTIKGIHPRNEAGKWTVWTRGPQDIVGRYDTMEEAEAVNAVQEERGRQWCAEVEETKNLPYLPWFVKHIEKPADWEKGKKYAHIFFGGSKGKFVGPAAVTVTTNGFYKGRRQWAVQAPKQTTTTSA